MTSAKSVSIVTIVLTVVCIIALVCHIVGFSVANWLESKPGLSTIKNIGLHVVCFDGYEHDGDPNLAYYGCRHFDDYYLKDIRKFLLPSWFEFVRSMEITSLVCMVVDVVLMLGCCACLFWGSFREKSRAKNILLQLLLYVAALLFTVTALLIIVAVAIFEMNAFNRDWLPRPDVNFLAYCFYLEVGVAVVTCICAIMALTGAIFQTMYMARMRIPSMEDDLTLS